MNPTTLVDLPRDVAAAEKERFENFKLGKSAQSNTPLNRTKHAHTRSHSRNGSISISPSASLPLTFPVAQKSTSTSANDMNPHFTFPLGNHNGATRTPRPLSMPLLPAATHDNPIRNFANPGSDRDPQAVSSTKRNSHHRRRSSVSTRHESAELMGMSLPDLPLSTSGDNVNFGEKDSIRRRALLALEGKPDVAFNKVEIPDFPSSDTEKLMPKLSLISSSNSIFGNGLNIINNKRDSFKLLAASASSKDQLHTLVEEEEEEENEESQHVENTGNPEHSLPSAALSIKESSPLTPTPDDSVAHPSLKHRPTALHLRPLSLTPENLMTAPSKNLHTPILTPISRSGLRSLSLLPSPANSENSISIDSVQQSKRCSVVISPTPVSKRPVQNLPLCQLDGNGDGEEKNFPERRSSISYKRSSNSVTVNAAGLPTPEMTPTTGRRFSNSESVTHNSISSIGGSTDEDQLFPAPLTQARPLSASEQHFLFRSHNALLARITDLEKALSTRRRESYGAFSTTSRPLSVSSNISGASDLESRTGSDGPSDEMLRLIADLKSERDELKRDVDGWRQRVNDLENQRTILVKRVESERRDAWVARSKAGLLEVEKGVLARKLEAVDELSKLHLREKEIWEKERLAFGREVDGYRRKVDDLEHELEAVRMDLEHEKAKVMSDPLATPTPNNTFAKFVQPLVVISPPESTEPSRKHGLGFMSVDSGSSATDVEPDSGDEGKFASGLPLRAVQEESYEEDHYEYEEDDGLATYEDEEDMDEMSIVSSSSFGSEYIHHAIHRYRDDVPPSPTTPTGAMFRPTHSSQPSLSQTWTFPMRPPSPARVLKKADETVDRFFDCLDDNDTDNNSVSSSPSSYSYEKSKGLFSRGFSFAPENDNASFFLPSNVDDPVLEEGGREIERTQLGVVVEEEEGEEEEEQEQGNYSEDEDMFGEIGGIKITFTPPQEEDDREEEAEERPQIQVSPPKRSSPPPVLPALDFGDGGDSDDDPFSFGHPLIEETFPLPPIKFVSTSSSSSPVSPSSSMPMVTPSSSSSSSSSADILSSASSVVPSSSPSISRSKSLCKRSPSISMIPRAASPLTVSRVTSPNPLISRPGNGTPLKECLSSASSSRSSSPLYATPPNRRGCVSPTSIPQPVASPLFVRTKPPAAPLKPKVAPSSTFIRQPSVRKPLLPTKVQTSTINLGSTNGSTMIPQPAVNLPWDSKMNINPLNRSSSDRRPFATFFNSLVNSNNDSSGNSACVQMKADASCDDNHHTQSQALTSSQAPSNPLFSAVIPPSPPPARLSFQTLTNLVSWPSRGRSVSVAPSLPSTIMPVPSRSASSRPEKFPEDREQFVSREKQLWRLKNRIEMEGVDVMKSGVHVQCKKCSGELVFI